jgi:hypothetical protein
LFLNPFNSDSAHHRPIGTGADYASSSHPATRDWLKASKFGINSGDTPWGLYVVEAESNDPVLKVNARSGTNGSRLPANVRFPKGGVDVHFPNGKDGNIAIYDRGGNSFQHLREYSWGNGKPVAGQFRDYDPRGLGHGRKMGERIGTSASGVAAPFGILRGHEINVPGHKIEHALQMVVPARAGCAVMLSKDIKLPATSRDGFASDPKNNTGNIPYGGLMALPPNVDIGKLGLSEPGRRLAEGIRNYGIYVVDNGGCGAGALRADQNINSQVMSQLARDIPKIYPYIRMVLNNDVLGNPVAGGGTALAPNCAFDGNAASVSTPQSKSSKGAPSNPQSASSDASSEKAAPKGSSGGTLTWAATNGANDYYLEIREDNSKQKKVYGRMVKPSAAGCPSGRGTCSFTTPSLSSKVGHKWKVRAVVKGKPQSFTAWAPVGKSNSTASNNQPSTKQAASVEYASTSQPSRTRSNGRELEWRATPRASHYYVEVRAATSKQPKVYGRVVRPKAGGCVSGGTCTHEIPGLPSGVEYKWKVRAVVNGDPQPYTKWQSVG